MKNPIPYSSLDIYQIADMADYLAFHNKLTIQNKEFVDRLIQCLTPEERENDRIKSYLKSSKE